MNGSTAFVILITPKKLIWKSRRASSGVTSSAAPMIPVPALLCSASMRPPVRSATALTQAATDSSEETSSRNNSYPAAGFPAGSRLVPKTRKPFSESNSAVALPIPDVAPVTTTTCLSLAVATAASPPDEVIDSLEAGAQKRQKPPVRRSAGG